MIGQRSFWCTAVQTIGVEMHQLKRRSYHFRGHNIAKSMIEDLSNPEIFPDGTLSDASKI